MKNKSVIMYLKSNREWIFIIMQNIRDGKLIYHLTKIEKLDSIFKNGLLCRSLVYSDLLNLDSFEDIADPNIIEKRNNLVDFVPFHFHPYSSFDNAVKHEYGAENFVYITVNRKKAKELNFKIIPHHPLSSCSPEFKIYDYDEGISCIDWEAMNTFQKGLGEQRLAYVRQVKMAECLSYAKVSVEDFQFIYCHESKLSYLRARYGSQCSFTKGEWFN